jgi:hypothetical protein
MYNKEQPGCMYYFCPMSIYNLGVVDHAHVYNDGRVGEHLHCHVYTEGIGKKGANNVALLIMKTLQKLNLLCKDSVGGELNTIFDNCSCQNENNTVLKLPALLMAMGYFKEIHFIFLVVGHTQNVADCLFNLLKQEIIGSRICSRLTSCCGRWIGCRCIQSIQPWPRTLLTTASH